MIDNLDQLLNEAKTVGISGHLRPDGDCVGSTLALYNYLKTYYKHLDVKIYLMNPPLVFNYLKGFDEILAPKKENRVFDLFFALDCGDADRLGDSFIYFDNAKTTICIDHHVSNTSFADYNYIIPEASSTCELVFNQITKDKINKEIAECLYTGIIHDTGVFQFSSTKETTMTAAGFLMSLGINYSKICDDSYYSKDYDANRILGQALIDSKMYADGRIIATVVTLKEMANYNVRSNQLDGIVNQLRNTRGTYAAVFAYELTPGEFKFSTRASVDLDLATLASKYGGGGHKRAAGFSLKGYDGWKLVEDVVSNIEKQIQELK